MHNPRPVLIAVMIFILLFAGLTIAVVVRHGLDILTLISLVILAMFGSGVAGALRQPPE